MNTVDTDKEATQGWPKREIYLGILAIVATIALCVVGLYYKDDLMSIANMKGYSLVGLFIIAFVASSTFSITAVPLPFWLLVLALPSILASQWGILAPVWIGLITAFAISLGQLLTFMIGYGSRKLSERLTARVNSRWYNRAIGWAERHGSWTVFLMSAVFNPIQIPMAIAIASLRYPPYRFFLYSFLGSAVKSFLVAFCGYYGLGSFLGF